MKVRKNALEWTVFAVSLLIIGAAVAILVTSMTRAASGPAVLDVTFGVAERSGSAFRVPVTVRNTGDETAAEAVVEVVLEDASGRALERASFTLPYVPRKSRREGSVVFTRDPSGLRVKTGAISFGAP